MLRALIGQIAVVDILLERHRPRDIVDLRHIVAVALQRTEELVESEPRVAGNMSDTDGFAWGIECAGDDHSRDMIDRDHVDGVIDIGAGGQLDASLDHSDEEVVGVGGCERTLASAKTGGNETVGYLLPVLESPSTYPGRTIVPFRPLRPASLMRNSPAHLLWP